MTNLDPTAAHKTALADPDDGEKGTQALTPAEIEKGLRVQLEAKNTELGQVIAAEKRSAARKTALRGEIAELERWLRAAKPRTYNRKPK